MYYILPEGLKIESNEPVYCTVYTVVLYTVQCTVYGRHVKLQCSVKCISYTLYKVYESTVYSVEVCGVYTKRTRSVRDEQFSYKDIVNFVYVFFISIHIIYIYIIPLF